MKKSIITIAIALCSIGAYCQQKVLPDTIRVKFTKTELQEIANKLDSVENMIVKTSTLPSYQVMSFNARIQAAFLTLWIQTNKQLVTVDTTKKPVVNKAIVKKVSPH